MGLFFAFKFSLFRDEIPFTPRSFINLITSLTSPRPVSHGTFMLKKTYFFRETSWIRRRLDLCKRFCEKKEKLSPK